MARKSILPWVLAAAGGAALVKGFFRPYRAVAKKGTVLRCSGPNQFGACDPSDVLEVEKGANVYATGAGEVVATGDGFVHILVSNEPVILMYDGIAPGVVEGQFVGRGQGIGTSLGTVYFSVSELRPGAKKAKLPYTMVNIVPSGWLAARGMKEVVKNTGNANKWCEQGRHIAVPASAVKSCMLQKPLPAGFALLPVSVEIG